jgi:hypothetical protein
MPIICPRCDVLDDPDNDRPCWCRRYRLEVTPPELSVLDATLIAAASAGGEA